MRNKETIEKIARSYKEFQKKIFYWQNRQQKLLVKLNKYIDEKKIQDIRKTIQ